VIEIKRPLARLIDGSSISGFEIAVSAAKSTRFSPDASPLPIIALPFSRMTARTSAKSRLPPKADITTAGTGIHLHRQKIAEAHTMFAE
jgi:hypothetical protein